MRKVSWIQYKACDAISQLNDCEIFAKQVLFQKNIHFSVIDKIKSMMNLLSGGYLIKTSFSYQKFFIGKHQIESVLESL